ncbi:MAG: manganese efflux pump [Nitrososphaerota archaeon]|nr:manganese efflux pump MntP family protein [Candidatus Bathyarchaeota archaeon]MDW8023395.1 manganese efflux pump [Nitrososphaerota archaeon]
MAVAFSTSTALLPLLGWLVGLAIYGWIESFSAWVVLIVFCGVGVWIIKEAFENKQPQSLKNVSSFWVLLATGVLGSLDEGAVGVGYPFLEIPILWIIVSVIVTNTILIYFAVLVGDWVKGLNRKLPSILAGTILIVLGILNFLELVFEI